MPGLGAIGAMGIALGITRGLLAVHHQLDDFGGVLISSGTYLLVYAVLRILAQRGKN